MAMGNNLEALKAKVIPIAISHAARPFAADVDARGGKRPVVKLHASKAVASRAARRDLLARLRETCNDSFIQMEVHGERALHKATSLEAFVRPVKGEIVFDPTGALARSRSLVAYAAGLRNEFGLRVKGVFWSGEWRTVYVVFDPERSFQDGKVKTGFLAEAELAARRLLLETCGPEATDFVAAVRLGFEAPPVAVIAIDRKSDWVAPTLANVLRRKVSMSALAAVFGLGTVGGAAAADIYKAPPAPDPVHLLPAPAVSGPNGKLAIMGGIMRLNDATFGDPSGTPTTLFGDRAAAVIGEGSFSVPLGHPYGFQLDVAGGTREHGLWMAGVGAHLFWRDPAQGLLGIIGSHARMQQEFATVIFPETTGKVTRKMSRLGGEAELYARDFTVAALAGYQWADGHGSAAPFGFGIASAKNHNGFFGLVDLTWYATDDFALSIGGEYSKGPGAFLRGGLEVHSAITGLSFFANGAIGKDNQYRAFAGLRFYFGAAPKSLKNRHRYDDPQINLATQSFGGFRQEYLK